MAATAQVVYGEVLWNPLTIILLWDNRAAKFFSGLLFAFATIATSEWTASQVAVLDADVTQT